MGKGGRAAHSSLAVAGVLAVPPGFVNQQPVQIGVAFCAVEEW